MTMVATCRVTGDCRQRRQHDGRHRPRVALTMYDAQHDHSTPSDDRAEDFRAEARGLRRRLTFWRRAAWLLLGIVVLVSMLAWQRTTIRRRECRQAFEMYARQAEESSLSQAPAEVMELHWKQFARGSANFPPSHYALIVPNWLRTPGEHESLPLAVCEQSHPGVLKRGRHVLFRDRDRTYIVWMSDAEAAPIMAEAHACDR